MGASSAAADVLTTGDIMQLLRVSRNEVIRLIDRGLLKGFRVPGSKHRRVMRTELIKFACKHGIPMEEERAESKRQT